MSHEGQIVHHFARPFDEDEAEHECLPSKPSHQQAPIFINGKFTTVDIKLEWLIRTFCAHGFTTRYSCQGYKNMKKAHKAGSGDHRGYIMFEGDSFYEMFQRIEAEVWPFNVEELDQVSENIGNALVTRDGRMIAPAQHGSHWAVELVRERDAAPAGPGFRTRYSTYSPKPVEYNTVIRFPRAELEGFRQIVETMFRNGVEL